MKRIGRPRNIHWVAQHYNSGGKELFVMWRAASDPG
jgi:hypothetical protein